MVNEDKNEEAIFNAAIQIESRKERDAYLDEACGGDKKLRADVEALLKAHYKASSLVDKPVFAPHVTLGDSPLTEGPGTRIGRYKLLQLIGEGGFGVVYMAEQAEPLRRRVALKIIKLGMDTKQVIARFEAERQALAMMDHPNIARVFDAGATDTGRPYFVMELVKGIPITEYCDKNNLDTRQRLDLFIDVCKAVQHAHQKGIIHRDIKPSNVMITLHDGKPVPKIIDFGIAKATQHRLTEKTLFTEYRQLIGTPEYMSPEQAEMSGLDVDTRSDIYSLGVLLYELLTGTTPFEAEKLRSAAYDEIRRIICENEPPKPSTRLSTLGNALSDVAKHRHVQPDQLCKIVRGDLDWVVMRALEKDRTRRYETANEFALDIGRYLGDEPVVAGPPSTVYCLRKFVRRHRTTVAASLLVVTAIVVGLVVSTTLYFQTKEARKKETTARVMAEEAQVQAENAQQIAQEEREKQEKEANRARIAQDIAERQAYCATIQTIWAKLKAGDHKGVRTMLYETDPSLRGWEWGYLKRMCQLPDWTLLVDSRIQQPWEPRPLAVSPDEKYILAFRSDELILLDRKDRHPIWLQRVSNPPTWPDAYETVFDPKGRFIVGIFDGRVSLCDIKSGDIIHQSEISDFSAMCIHPDGSKIYAGTRGGRIFVLDTSKLETHQSFHLEERYIRHIAIDSEGEYLVTASSKEVHEGCRYIYLHNAKNLEVIAQMRTISNEGARGIAILNKRGVIVVVEETSAYIYEIGTLRRIKQLKGHDRNTRSIRVSADEKWIITGSSDGTANVYDTENWQLNGTIYHDSEVLDSAFLQNNKILTIGLDGTMKQWLGFSTPSFDPAVPIQKDGIGSYRLTYRSDGHKIAFSGWGYTKILLFDTVTREINFLEVEGLADVSGDRKVILFRPDSNELAVQTPGWLRFYDTAVASYPQIRQLQLRDEINDAAFKPNGRLLGVSYSNGEVDLIDIDTNNVLKADYNFGHLESSRVVFSNDGSMFAIAEKWGLARIVLLDSSTGKTRWQVQVPDLKTHSYNGGLTFHPEGHLLATGMNTGVIKIWDVKSGACIKSFKGHRESNVDSLQFSPDGTRLLSGSGDRTMRIWDWKLEKELLVFNHNEYVLDAHFSPDGLSITTNASYPNFAWIRTALPWMEESQEYRMEIPVRARSFEGHHYFMYNSPMNWRAANSYCESIGAHLATMTSEAEMAWIRETFDSPSDCWLGGTDEDLDGVWTWVTGEEWQYSFWGEGEPNNYLGIEHALEMQSDGYWNDNDMEKLNYCLIEWDR